MALFTEGKLFRAAGTGSGSGGGDQHNLGYYATQAALEEAHPTASAGDWAIVGATDTVWVWDEDSSSWVDTDTKGEVTPDMVIIKSAVMPAASSVPASAVYQYVGTTNATYTQNYIYKNTTSTELVGPSPDATEGEPGESMVFSLDGGAFNAYLLTKGISLTGQSVFYLYQEYDEQDNPVYMLQDSNYEEVETFGSLTVMANTTGITWGGQDDFTGDFPYIAENTTGFVVEPAYAWTRIDVQPTPEAIKVNTTATLAAADWSSNTQTVSITGVTADGVVFVNPTPANQSAYTDAGILCTAQAAGSLTFTCDTVPSADITVTVVML